MTKRCSSHEQDHELMSGRWRCRACHSESKRRWRERTGYKPVVTPEMARRYNDKNWYGLTPEQSDELRSITSCQACGSDGGDQRLNLDHCHQTGEVRGMLCRPCNLALGHVKDDPIRLRALAEYLEK